MKARDILIWAGFGAGAGALLYFLSRKGAAATPRRKFTLSLVSGVNYVSIPLSTTMKASDLKRAIKEAGGEPARISRWDPEIGWVTEEEKDFNILPYEGYLIDCIEGGELEIEGRGVTEHTYTLPVTSWQPNVIFIGIPFITGLSASDLYNMLENPAYVCKYASGTGTSTCYPDDKDFPLRCGEGYFVGADNARNISFTLSGEPCGTPV